MMIKDHDHARGVNPRISTEEINTVKIKIKNNNSTLPLPVMLQINSLNLMGYWLFEFYFYIKNSKICIR